MPNNDDKILPSAAVTAQAGRLSNVLQRRALQLFNESATSLSLDNSNLTEIVEHLGVAARVLQALSEEFHGPTHRSKTAEIMTKLQIEVARMNTGVASKVLSIPDSVSKQSRWLHPDTIDFRYACIGYLDILEPLSNPSWSRKLIVQVIKENGRSVSVTSLLNWQKQYGDNYENIWRLFTRFDLSEDYSHQNMVPMSELTIAPDLSLATVEVRLRKSISALCRELPDPILQTP